MGSLVHAASIGSAIQPGPNAASRHRPYALSDENRPLQRTARASPADRGDPSAGRPNIAQPATMVRLSSYLESDTAAIPSRAAAWDRLRDVRTVTSRIVAFSISASDAAA